MIVCPLNKKQIEFICKENDIEVDKIRFGSYYVDEDGFYIITLYLKDDSIIITTKDNSFLNWL